VNTPDYVRPEGALLYSAVATNDEFAAEYIRGVDPKDRIDVHNAAISTGYRALAGAKGNGALMALSDQLDNSVKAASAYALGASKDVKAVMEAHLAPTGPFGQMLGALDETLARHLGPDSKELQAFRELTRLDFAKGSKAMIDEVRGMMNLADDTSPMAKVHRDVRAIVVEVAKLKTQVEAQTQVSQARRALPLNAGRGLEGFLSDVISPIAAIHGESFDDVRDVPSSTKNRSKIGDFVTTLDQRFTRGVVTRVVVEAKNRRSVTVSNLLRELDAAMEGRQATSAIGILTNPSAKCRPIAGYAGNKVIVSLPHFGEADFDYEVAGSLVEIGYEYARLLAVSRSTMTPLESLDLVAITTGIDEISEAVKGFKELADNHTRIVTAVDAARATSAGLREKLIASGKKLRCAVDEELSRIEARKALPGGSSEAA